MKNKRLSLNLVIVSYAVFILGWIVRVACVDLSGLSEYAAWGIGFLIHFVWWFLFACFMIGKYNRELVIPWKEMITTKPKKEILLPLLLFALAYNAIVFFFQGTGFHIEMKLYDLIITVLTVGIFEEGVFRGWFLNAIAGFTSKRRANLISSAMFVFVHYPSWIFHGNDISTIISVSIPMYGLSLIFGWAFRKSRSIWTGVIFHSFWDLLSFIM